MALQKLGPFELLKVLGRGGMGTVYKARDSSTDDIVALKALAPAYSFDEHFRNRFEGEIDALLKLDHPNIVRLLSYGQDEGNLFFAMELVEGNSLYVEQKKGHVFHWREVIAIGIQVCDGLRHAHDRGIIHRDLKPGNLMLNSSRMIKITDFGIAKTFGGSSLTGEGNVLGTMDFMAPEQARGKPATTRSDLFSLGAVMYSMLAGRPPFLRETTEQTFAALLSGNPPDKLNDLAADVPSPLAQLVHRLLEKDPKNRIATAQATERQLMHVLEAISRTESPDTQVVSQDDANEDAQLLTGQSNSATFLSQDVKSKDKPSSHTINSASESARKNTSASVDPTLGKTIETSEEEITQSRSARQPDYYTEITADHRRDDSWAPGKTKPTGNIWPILLGLFLVFAIGAFGIWYTIFKRPSAHELLAEIDKNESSNASPVRVLDQLNMFLNYYPDNSEYQRVKKIKEYAEARRYRNSLALAFRRSQEEVSEIEEKFLNITGMSRSNVHDAVKRMRDFLADIDEKQYFENKNDLSDEDQRCIRMAKIYYHKLQSDEKIKEDEDRQSIMVMLKRAKLMQRDDPEKADIYAFIIKEYNEHTWVSELVDEAKKERAKLDD